VGKSSLLNVLTTAESRVGDYDFTTLNIVPGIMKYRHAEIQVLDMPGIIKGAAKGRGRGREVLSILRAADLICIVIDVFNTNIDGILRELYEGGIRVNCSPPSVKIERKERGGICLSSTVPLTRIEERTIKDILREFGYVNADVVIREDITVDRLIDALSKNRVYVDAMIVLNKIDLVAKEYLEDVRKIYKDWDIVFVSAKEKIGIEELKDKIYRKLNFIGVYLKPQGGKVDMSRPMILRKGARVEDVCRKIHRDFVEKFRYAIVWGRSVKFDGQRVGLDHVVEDGDIISIVIWK